MILSLCSIVVDRGNRLPEVLLVTRELCNLSPKLLKLLSVVVLTRKQFLKRRGLLPHSRLKRRLTVLYGGKRRDAVLIRAQGWYLDRRSGQFFLRY